MRLGIHPCAIGAATFALACSFSTIPASAALIANDNASDLAYSDGWQPNDNGGTGWAGGWTFRANTGAIITATNASRGWFVSSSTNNDNVAGDTNGDGDINSTGSKAWGLYSNGPTGNEIFAVRPFAGALDVGQTITFDMDNGNVASSAVVGVRLLGNPLTISSREFEFRFVGGDSNYTTIGATSQVTTIPFTREGVHVEFTLTSTSTYSLTATRIVDGATFVTTGTTVSGAPIQGLALRNQIAGTGATNDGYFNNISIVPEPSALGLVLLAPLVTRRRRGRDAVA